MHSYRLHPVYVVYVDISVRKKIVLVLSPVDFMLNKTFY